jgi:uncharacterized protein with WD repeat
MWNAPSTAALFMATCETDATNQSYYGESKVTACVCVCVHTRAALAVSDVNSAQLLCVLKPRIDSCCCCCCFVHRCPHLQLHYLPAEASRADAACSVAMPKEGPVHDVQWSPAGDFFVVIAGFMPAKVRSEER